MDPVPQPLRFYGRLSDASPLEWPWVDAQLEAAGTYWVVARDTGHPHPRPVWGVWDGAALHLSIGSPHLVALVGEEPAVTLHLDSGTDVVIVEGLVTGTNDDRSVLDLYDAKYDWSYDRAEYGLLTVVSPTRVLSWRSGGWAGREGFREAGAWSFEV